jgi:hypothetical protein
MYLPIETPDALALANALALTSGGTSGDKRTSLFLDFESATGGT